MLFLAFLRMTVCRVAAQVCREHSDGHGAAAVPASAAIQRRSEMGFSHEAGITLSNARHNVLHALYYTHA